MPKVFRDLLTGADNVTHDVVRWAAALACLNGFFLIAWDVIVHKHAFDFQAYGAGVGLLLAGVGAALKLKQDTEPKP